MSQPQSGFDVQFPFVRTAVRLTLIHPHQELAIDGSAGQGIKHTDYTAHGGPPLLWLMQ
jgi:hypothetical protein